MLDIDARDHLKWALDAAAKLVFGKYTHGELETMKLVSDIYSNIDVVLEALRNGEIEVTDEYDDEDVP